MPNMVPKEYNTFWNSLNKSWIDHVSSVNPQKLFFLKNLPLTPKLSIRADMLRYMIVMAGHDY